MSDWDRVATLFTEALTQPSGRRVAFVRECVPVDESGLAEEVLSLLEHAVGGLDFLDRISREVVSPVLAHAFAEIEDVDPPGFEQGSVFSDRYRIQRRVASGGMGVVVQAADLRLGRTVALKVLPARAHADPEARARFVLEARTASSLDHPNIGVVHDLIETPDGRDVLVLAHYAGRTLREWIETHAADLDRGSTIGLGVLEGLEAAHARGIVHGDVKPENVLLTDQGGVKILDFGLARFLSDVPTSNRSAGTPPYMAPEQLAGGGIDLRTDVWALAVTLWEVATGRRPFTGDGPEALGRAIREEDPSGSEWVPPDLRPVLERALSKDPGGRYPDAGAFRAAFEAAVDSAPNGAGLGRRGWAAAALGAALVVVAVSRLVGGEDALRMGAPRQLSSAEGVEDFADWSPRSDALVYHGTRAGEVFGGRPDVWLRRLDEDVPVNLTADHPGFDGYPSWAPTGDRVVFYSDRDGGGYFVIDTAGAQPRPVWRGTALGGGHNRAAWSPDGRSLAITVDGGADGAALEIVSAGDGASERRLALPGRSGNLIFGTTWSPDGRFVAFTDAMNLTPDESRLWVLRLADGEAYPLTDGSDLAWSPTWGPESRWVAYVSDRGGDRDLWIQRLDAEGRPDGDPSAVTTGIGIRNAALSADGARMAYSRGRLISTVWRIPIRPEGPPATWDDAAPVTSDRSYVEFVEVDPRSGDVWVSSDRAGDQDLWRFPADGDPPERITDDPAADWAPTLSPDGSRLAYYSARSGNRELWVRTLSTGEERRVTDHAAIDFVPAWSPDGRHLVFSSGRSGNLDIWTLQLATGALRQITSDPAMDAWPRWSPDGATLAFRSNREDGWRVWSVPVAGGEPQRLTDVATTYFRWTADGSALVLVGDGAVWWHDLRTGAARPLTDLNRRQGTLGVVALAVHDGWAYVTWEEDVGDLWMMERTR